MTQTSGIRINLSAVEHNVRVLRRVVGPDCAICPIVKADAYGLGAAPIARHLEAAGVDMLAVYTPGQAAELARAAVGGPILVLMPVRDLDRADEAYRLLIQDRLHLTVHDRDHLDDLIRIAERYATVVPLHLEIDTGMSRGGCAPAAAEAIIGRVAEHRWLRLAGLSTHFAKAGTDARFTNQQLAAFDAVIERCGPLLPSDCAIHAANTFATLRNRRYHKLMIRVGQAWAGYGHESMTAGQFRRDAGSLRPILTWKSRIVGIKTIPRGATVGYGATWTARRRSRIGLVPVGYADGYPTGAAATDDQPKPPCVGVRVQDGRTAYARVVGQVNMDQITIDLTEIAPPDTAPAPVGPGTEVELIGCDPGAPNHLVTVARAAGAIPHELLCGLNPRIRRVYHAKEPYSRGDEGTEAPGRQLQGLRD